MLLWLLLLGLPRCGDAAVPWFEDTVASIELKRPAIGTGLPYPDQRLPCCASVFSSAIVTAYVAVVDMGSSPRFPQFLGLNSSTAKQQPVVAKHDLAVNPYPTTEAHNTSKSEAPWQRYQSETEMV